MHSLCFLRPFESTHKSVHRQMSRCQVSVKHMGETDSPTLLPTQMKEARIEVSQPKSVLERIVCSF